MHESENERTVEPANVQPALMPLRNFRYVGPLTPEAEEWWQSFGRFLGKAREKFDGDKFGSVKSDP